MSALKYWLWLTELPGLTNQTRLALLQHFPTPEDVYYAEAEEVLLTEGITREQAILLENKDCAAADRILADCQRLNVNILTLQDAGYPNRLRNIYDPPCLLYVRGRLPAFDDEAAVAVVGTRTARPTASPVRRSWAMAWPPAEPWWSAAWPEASTPRRCGAPCGPAARWRRCWATARM